MTKTVKLNATGRYTLSRIVPDESDLYDTITAHGIMEPMELSEGELAALVGYAEQVENGDVHWHNAKMRLKRAHNS